MDTTRIDPARTTPIIVVLAALVVALLATAPAADAKPRCFGKKATVVGTNGKDRLKGSPGKDVVVARGGKDDVNTGPGKDYVCGGGGNDRLRSGHGSDKLDGGPGNDEVHGADDNDALVKGGKGNDFCDGQRGDSDKLVCGPGDDRLPTGYFQEAHLPFTHNVLLTSSAGAKAERAAMRGCVGNDSISRPFGVSGSSE